MKIENLSIDDIKRGYIFNDDLNCYSCIKCTKTYEVGEIYKIGNRFFEASKAIELHVELEHSDYLEQLLNSDSKYNTLTENQKQLFQLFISDLPDKEIAKQVGVSTSTIRHQKFIFREKAKQAKLYLALYESVFEDKSNKSSTIIPIHEHARMVDERYGKKYSEKEVNQILESIYDDFATIRRYLIEYGFMSRNKECTKYWLT